MEYKRRSLLFALATVLAAAVHANPIPVVQTRPWVVKFYGGFFESMREVISNGKTRVIKEHMLMPDSRDTEPLPHRLIKVPLEGDGQDTASLYFRDDNLYLCGFANKKGDVFYMTRHKDLFPEGSIALPFGGSYPELTGRTDKDVFVSELLKEVRLGREPALMHSSILADYEHGTTQTQIKPVKDAMLGFAIMVSEAQRLKIIGDKMKEHWSEITCLTELEAQSIGAWAVLSIAFCRPDVNDWTSGKTKLDRLDVRTHEQVSEILDLVKWEKDCDRNYPPDEEDNDEEEQKDEDNDDEEQKGERSHSYYFQFCNQQNYYFLCCSWLQSQAKKGLISFFTINVCS